VTTFEEVRGAAPTLSVGILTADWGNLSSGIVALARTEARLLHFDVMDGCFVPMMTIGPPVIAGLETSLLKDVHLMVEDPLEKIDAYVAAGADILTVHVEACPQPGRVLQKLGGLPNANDPARGIVRGAAVHPGTPLEALEPLLEDLEMITLLAIHPGWGGQSFLGSTFRRIERTLRMIELSGRDILLCVDGGVKKDNVADIGKAGVDVVVTGSAVFDGRSPVDNAVTMLERLRAGRAERM
jgi:ribulose-phosphate 3-epimerase